MSEIKKEIDKTSLWTLRKEEEILPFFDWTIPVENEKHEIELMPIDEIEIVLNIHPIKMQHKVIQSKFGLQTYIPVLIDNEEKLLRINSLRLRNALITVCDKAKFPLTILLIREGLGFSTTYSAKAIIPKPKEIKEPKTKKE